MPVLHVGGLWLWGATVWGQHFSTVRDWHGRA